MRWYHALTRRQRRILAALAGATLAVMGGLAFTVWRTLSAFRALPTLTPTPRVLVSHLLTPSPTPYRTPTPTATPPFDPREAGSVAEEVAVARGVVARWGTPLTLVSRYELTVALYRRYQAAPPPAKAARATLDALGLWFWGETVHEDVRTQAQYAAALYVPEERQIYLRRDWEGDLRTLKLQLAYAYARALGEQYGHLAQLRQEAPTLDQHLALEAVAYGDAMVALWRYADLRPGTGAAQEAARLIAEAVTPRWTVEDPLLEDISALPARLGIPFALALYGEGGLDALDRALRRPPLSTQQVLHPERYVAGEEPVPLPPLRPVLGAGWALTHTDTVGEAMMGLVMLEWGVPDALSTTLPHLLGDTLQVWGGPDGGRVVLWQTVWDDWRVARAFAEGVEGAMPRRVPGPMHQAAPPMPLPQGIWWSGPEGAAFLYRYGAKVWLLWGTEAEAVGRVGQALEEARRW